MTATVTVRTNAAEARRLSAISPSRNLERTGTRGVYTLTCAGEVAALRDAATLTEYGAQVLSVD